MHPTGIYRIRIYGVDIPANHIRTLIGALIKLGNPNAIAAAEQISGALSRHARTVGPLTPATRDAILAALSTLTVPPGLKPLQQALNQDHRARQQSGEAVPDPT